MIRAGVLGLLAFSGLFFATAGHVDATEPYEDPSEDTAKSLTQVADTFQFDGEIAISHSSFNSQKLLFTRQENITDPETIAAIVEYKRNHPDATDADAMEAVMEPGRNPRWPWASVTKQIIAVLIMQQAEDGKIDLERRAGRYLPALRRSSPTIRQLLQHQSGLRNPDDSPADADGVPDFYTTGPTGLDWCLQNRSAPGGDWRYNNCDYIVLGAILEKLTKKSISQLIEDRIGDRIGWSDTSLLTSDSPGSYKGQNPSYNGRIARYGASAALVGPLDDMLRFDRAFFGGSSFTRPIFSRETRDAMWDSDPALGYMALGQWVFEAPLAGCDAPIKIVERRGAIGKYQLRNVILPQSEKAIAIATEKDGFEFGEIWMGQGFMYEALSIVACS